MSCRDDPGGKGLAMETRGLELRSPEGKHISATPRMMGIEGGWGRSKERERLLECIGGPT